MLDDLAEMMRLSWESKENDRKKVKSEVEQEGETMEGNRDQSWR